MHKRNNEKAKDFKGSLKRLIKELKNFKLLIIISLILAALSAILSILGPDKLSNLTDEIQKGIVVKTDNLKIITTNISNSLNEEKLSKIIPEILKIDLQENKVNEILKNDDIKDESKQQFKTILNDKDNLINSLAILDDEILNIILTDSTYNNINITKTDKIQFIKSLNNLKNNTNQVVIPNSIASILFENFIIDGTEINYIDQAKFVSLMNIDKTNPNELYNKIEQMPENIQKVVKPFMNMDSIKKITLILVCLYLCSAIFNYIQSISMTTVANKFAKKLRSNISGKINKLPLKYFDNNSKGDILSRITNDVDTMAQTMNNSLSSLVSSITLFIGTIIMMFITNSIMAITAIISSLLGFMFMGTILSKSQKYFILKQEQLGLLNGHIEEIYSGHNVVKVYNGKKQANEKFDELNNNMYESNRKSQFLSGLMHPLMGFIGNFGYVAVCIVGALLTMNGTISFGVIVAFITYVRTFTNPLSQIAQAMASLQSATAASERVFEFMDEEEMSDEKHIIKHLDKSKVRGEIEFCNVSFTYDGNDLPTIKNFSAKAKKGEKIAIVGPTGAGKTTMVNLLMKFYEISKGDIKIDGVSINDLTRENIHSLFTMVLQDTWLFNGTIKENIIYNRENISKEEVEEVCKIVGVDHFIKTLPHGYDSVLSDNDSISAGQKQLLTIARAMLEDAPFLILDEATSNVDTRTEELVATAMDKLTIGRTSFIIAHRLSTIKNADLILVMKDGNIIETGNHNELIKQNGFYAELYNSQFQN